MKTLLLLTLSVFYLSGCADHLPTHTETITYYKPDGTVSHTKEVKGAPPTSSPEENAAKIACYKSIDARKIRDAKITDSLTPSMRGMVLQAQAFSDLIAQMQGVSVYTSCDNKDPNVYTYLIEDTKAANETRQKFSAGMWGSMPIFALGYSVKKGYDAAGDTTGGNKITVTGSENEVFSGDVTQGNTTDNSDNSIVE